MPEPVSSFNDRAWVLEHQDRQQQQRQLLDHVAHYQALGLGLAALCQTMYDALAGDERFTKDERLALIQSAIHGR